MSFRRQISWSAATRDMRNARPVPPRGALAARSHISVVAKIRRLALVTPAGAYDRAAIMTLAISAAKNHQANTGDPWSVCISIALKAAWFQAQVARLRAAH